MVQLLWKTVEWFLKKIKNRTIIRDTGKYIFITTLFATPKIWKQLRYSSIVIYI